MAHPLRLWRTDPMASSHISITGPERRSMARLMIRAHAMIRSRFGENMYRSPAWEMMLDLYVNDGGRPVSLTSLAGAASVSSSTALRSIEILVSRNLLRRIPDPHDGRRINVLLSPRAVRLLNRHFDHLVQLFHRA